MRRCLVVLVALGALDAFAQDRSEYVVQAGDTWDSVARKLFGDQKDATTRLRKLNSKWPGGKLVPSQTLKTGKEEPDARLFAQGDVAVRYPEDLDWKAAKPGQALFQLDQVKTLAGAAAEIGFKDEVTLHLRAGATAVVQRLVAKGPAAEVLEGPVRLRLSPLHTEPVGLKTPAALVTARSGELEVVVDEARASLISVHEGVADVAAGGRTVSLAGGEGTRVVKGKPPEKGRPLLPPPAWVKPPAATAARLLFAGTVEQELEWSKVERAVGYRVEVARDQRFVERVMEETVKETASAPRATAPGLAPGRYWARVQALDADGLASDGSEPRRIEVLQVKIERGAAPAGEVKGAGEVRLSVAGTEEMEITVDGVAAIAAISLTAVGRHAIRVTPRNGTGEAFAVVVEPPKAKIELTREGDAYAAVVQLVDDLGAPLALEGTDLSLAGKDGAKAAPLQPEGEGRWRAAIEPGTVERRRVASVEALWAGLPIGAARAEHELPPPEPLPPPPPPPPPVVAAERGAMGQPAGLVESASLPAAFPPAQGLLAELRVQPDVLRAGVEGVGNRLTLGAEARTGPRSAASLSLSTRSILAGPTSVPAGFSLTVGGRVIGNEEVGPLSLALDATFALRGLPGDTPQAIRLREALIKVWRLGQFDLAVTQGFALAMVGGDTRPSYDSAYQLWYKLRPDLALTAELDGIALMGKHAVVGYGLAAGGTWTREAIDVGLSLRTGLGGQGRQVWGRFGALIMLGYRAELQL